MPNTLIPIQTYTLSSSAASVTFSNIPQNYTDLKVVVSARTTNAATSDTVLLNLNGLTTNQSSRRLQGDGSVASSSSFSLTQFVVNGNTATASTFGSAEIYIPNYNSTTTYKSISIDSIREGNETTTNTQMWAGLWSSNSAVTSIQIAGQSTSFLANSTFTLYGISNGVKETGGTLTVAGGYAYHTFTSTGSFLPSQQIKGAEVLCIAGGGGGSGTTSAAGSSAGGGAGGINYFSYQTLNAGSIYTALIGAGGSGGSVSTSGSKGANSQFGSLTAADGGGFGGRSVSSGTATNGGPGGSGGGGGYSGGTPGTGGVATSGQGFNGGNGFTFAFSGGGGGSAEVGNTDGQGFGGDGTSLYSSWGLVTGTGQLSGGIYYYAGGGSGAGNTANSAGLGGGALGGTQPNGNGQNATSNTGGGGGGGGDAFPNAATAVGGSGGSGLIIVRYPLS